MIEILATVLTATAGVYLYHLIEWTYYKIEHRFSKWKHEEEISKFDQYIKSLEKTTKKKK